MTLNNMVFMINNAKSAPFLIYTMYTVFHWVGHAAETITIHFRAELPRHSGAYRSTAARVADTRPHPHGR